jgi:hypothetical protein
VEYIDVWVLQLYRFPDERRWQGYPFPTEAAAYTFGIRTAHRGTPVKLKCGAILRRVDVEDDVAKSLRPVQRKSLRPARYVVELKTYQVPVGTVFNPIRDCMVTTMADGIEVAWDVCSSCTNHVRTCTCARGIVASHAVQMIAYKTAGVVAGLKWDDVPPPRREEDTSPRTTFVHPWREDRDKGKSLRSNNNSKSLPSSGKSLRPTTTPTEKSLRPAGPELQVDKNFDLSSLDSTAATSAASTSAALAKKLSAKGKSLRPHAKGKK